MLPEHAKKSEQTGKWGVRETVLSPIETALSGRLNKPARRIVRYLSFNIISAGARFNFQSTAFPKDEGKLETGL
jgi:hypothetical protein